MKNWLALSIIAVFVIGAVLMSGCTTNTDSLAPVSTPTTQMVTTKVTVTPTLNPNPNPTPQSTGLLTDEPVIGVWRYSSSAGVDERIQFNADKTYKKSYYYDKTQESDITTGYWCAQAPESRDGYFPYILNITSTSGVKMNFFYSPQQHAIYDDKYKNQLFLPFDGSVMTL